MLDISRAVDGSVLVYLTVSDSGEVPYVQRIS